MLKYKYLSPYRLRRHKVWISGSFDVAVCIIFVSTYFIEVDGTLFNCLLPVGSMEMLCLL
jgi:hypothetical protein